MKWAVAFAVIIGLSSIIPFGLAWTAYPRQSPIKPSFTPVPFSPVTNDSGVETFVINRPGQNNGFEAGLPQNTIVYTVNGSSITSQTLLNVTVTVNISAIYPAAGFFIDPQYAMIEDSQAWITAGPNHTAYPQEADEHMEMELVSNSSRLGLTYSTSYFPFNDTSMPELGNTISLNNGGQLTGEVVLLIGSTANPNSSAWFQAFDLAVTNTTQIDVQSYQDMQLAKQNNALENDNLANNAQIQYDDALTQHNDGVVTALTWAIITFMLVDIAVSVYDARDKSPKKEEGPEGDGDPDEDCY